jgi:CBS domain-containing protein
VGEQDVQEGFGEEERRRFTRALLDDLRALELLLDTGRFETGVRRIGAEQEMFLVDRHFDPASVAPDVLRELKDPRFTTELGRFNLEANLPPLDFGGTFLRQLHDELTDINEVARTAAQRCGADILLVGILPTLQRQHLSLEHMTPVPRYYELNRRLIELKGGIFQANIEGMDELKLEHDNVMLEACNTSYQLHWQVDPDEFAAAYNIAQLITAPILALAVNSPVLLTKRLWHETRIALFEQSIDVRREASLARGQTRRVGFGGEWVDESILQLFQGAISNHRVVMTRELDEPSTEVLARGETPGLGALCLHNGTVYSWNRPCYGVHNGVPHLRIENRVLPAGPTVVDEVVNAALFFGLMAGMPKHVPDPRGRIPFDSVRGNFVAAARQGMYAGFHWLDDEDVPVDVLLREQLIPIAREGLLAHGTDPADVDLYLGMAEERARTRRTGALWIIQSLDQMAGVTNGLARHRAVTAAFAEQQHVGKPIHEWVLADPGRKPDWRAGFRRVEQIMSSKLFTVGPDDLVDLAASVMDWNRIRHLPVEEDGNLVGILSSRALLRLVAKGGETGTVPVRDVMRRDVLTVSTDATPMEAITLMREKGLGALPVVRGGKLVGIVSERDFLELAGRVLQEALDVDGG